MDPLAPPVTPHPSCESLRPQPAPDRRRAQVRCGGRARSLARPILRPTAISTTLLIAVLIGGGIALPPASSAAEQADGAANGRNPFDAIDLDLDWRVGGIDIQGHEHVSRRDLEALLLTRPRAWYAFWRDRPELEPSAFELDITRLRRHYESEGFYSVEIDWSLAPRRGAKPPILDFTIQIDEGQPAQVNSIEVRSREGFFESEPLPLVWAQRPSPGSDEAVLEEGGPFREPAYHAFENQLERGCLERGHPSCSIERQAFVDVDRTGVDVVYDVEIGPQARVRSLAIEGYDRVDVRLIEREIAIEIGDLFSLREIEATKRRLLALDLFSLVRIEWRVLPDGDVDLVLTVGERAPRELRIGVGYSTEEQYRGQVRWKNVNWLGGGRRLTATGRYSTIVSSATLSVVQPHFFERRQRAVVGASLFQQDERSFTRNSIQSILAFERDLTPNLVLNLGFRLETAEVRDVDGQLSTRIGGVRREGRLFGPRISLRWSPVDNLFNPSRGLVTNLLVEHSGPAWGATYSYYKVTGDVAAFYPLFWDMVVATRLRIGVADSLGSKERLPIFERFYAGGEQGVRGYQRRQLGPTADNGDPLGGRSLIEGSLELRIPVWKNLGVVAFADAGQVELGLFDLVPDDVRYTAGPGVTYDTPVGPISLFAGFPINDQPGEPSWQLHLSIGFFF